MLKPAFSLIELLVVVAIIGILAALGTVGYGNYIAQTKIKVVDTNRINLGSLIQTQIMTNLSGIDNKTYANCSAFIDDLIDQNNKNAKNAYNTSSSAPVYLNAHKQTPGNDNQIKFAAGQYLVSCSDACEKVLVDASFTVCSCEETGGCSTTSGIDSACPIVESWSGPVSCP